MATAALAQMLDELMGRDRNLDPSIKRKEILWDDAQVCKYFLVKFCPNQLFVNTRADLGPCDKIHDEEHRKQFTKAPDRKRMEYEDVFIRFCRSMMADVERRIERGKQRLQQEAQESEFPTSIMQVGSNEEKIRGLTERINSLVEQVETLGTQGKVEEAQGLMKLCEKLQDEREGLRHANEGSYWQQTVEIAVAQEKQMEVCEVCGAFLIVGDAPQRIDDHLQGKMHVGYARIKAALHEFLEKRAKEKGEREKDREERNQRDGEREERHVERERDRNEREDRNRSRDKEEEKPRERRDREREQREPRDRDHRDRDQRGDRDRRDRDGPRRRSRSRDRGDRYNRGDRIFRDHRFPDHSGGRRFAGSLICLLPKR